tara:strand:- start:1737 stop:2204 length:468 start_codon:yes stop_codon:yes gene_type:complete
MELTDSKEKLLKGPEIITQAAYNLKDLGYSHGEALFMIGIELGLPRTDQIQVGNTVFLGHKGKGAGKKKIVGRVFNVDTPRNFIVNAFKYMTYLQKRKVTHYSIEFEEETFLTAFKIFERAAKGKDTEVAVAKYKNSDRYMAYVKIGKQPLTGRM